MFVHLNCGDGASPRFRVLRHPTSRVSKSTNKYDIHLNLDMKKLLVAFLCVLGAVAAKADYALLPVPARISPADGEYVIPSKELTVSGKDAKLFARDLGRRGVDAKTVSKGASVTLSRDASLPGEGYTLNVTPSGIEVKASAPAGFYYAAQTLAQMVGQNHGALPSVEISDAPRFGYRGMMIDVVRCYLPFDELKKLVDEAAALKINNVHLHLTDDNGWRLEIKKYPKLTEVGAWRVDRPEMFPARLNARSPEEKATYGGFYTQKQMRELVKYAAERHVNIIPEIELPAHAAAAIASYPELKCPVDSGEFVGVFPGIGGKDASIIMCGGNDKVIEFYNNIFDEVMDVFPSENIHLGGDEAAKDRWKRCPLCQERIKKLGLKDEEELQAWLMNQISDHIIQAGRTPMGWDEATYGKPNKEMIAYGWQGMGQVAVNDARESGRRFIMTPAQKCYLIRYQGPQWFEPFTYFGNVTFSDIYNYEPVEADWTPELEKQMIGFQGSLWTEFCRTEDDVEYLLFPRMLAIAERAWAPKGRHDLAQFVKSVDRYIPGLEERGINVAKSMYNIQHKVVSNGDGTLTVELACERPDVDIRWTTGDNLDASARNLGHSVVIPNLSGSCTITAATFDRQSGRQLGKTLVLPIRSNLATGRPVTVKNAMRPANVLTNGVRGSERFSDFEYVGWNGEPVDLTVDLGEVKPVGKVVVGTVANSDFCSAAPLGLVVYGSENGRSYKVLKQIASDQAAIFKGGARKTDYTAEFPKTNLRYIRVIGLNPGAIPDGYPREGVPAQIYVDEIIVE